MAECAYCKTETQLYVSNVPVCLKCSDEPPEKRRTKATLLRDLQEATKRADEASDAFLAITTEIPSGFPHPDGTQQIHNASHKLTAAREAMMKAHTRLNDYLERGIVPEELKQGS
jgi:hypothetical protein